MRLRWQQLPFSLLISGVLISILSGCDGQKLPIYGVKSVDESGDTVYYEIPEATFTDQNNKPFSNQSLRGKIYTADFFFTSCPSICPRMKKNMLKVQEAFKDEPDIHFLSHSLDPKYDTPEVMKRYAENLGADEEKWHFVTGDQDKIFEVAQKGYFVAAYANDQAPGGIDHSGKIALIDRKGRIRGYYLGAKSDELGQLEEPQIDQLIADIKVLLDED